jgi:hypothetical protein
MRQKGSNQIAIGLAIAGILLASIVFLATRLENSGNLEKEKLSVAEREPSPLKAPAIDWTEQFEAQGKDPTPPQLPAHPDWEVRLDDILGSEEDNGRVVRRLVEDLANIPLEAQSEFIAHALNLCEDEDFELLASVYLRPETPSEVKEQIFDEALNRPDETKLPLMARTMEIPNHPMAGEAKEILALYLDVDPDLPNPVNWRDSVRVYLQEDGKRE